MRSDEVVKTSVRCLTWGVLVLMPVQACSARGPDPAPRPDSETVVGDLGHSLDSYLSRAAADDEFSGVFFVSRGDVVILNKGYGLSNRGTGTRYSPSTVFPVHSLTKQFTAAAILQLEIAGRLSVEDSLDEFFPDVPPGKRGITIHHLLSHTSGFARDFGGDYRRTTRVELVGKLLASKLAFTPPGSRFSYSNGGYSLLAAIIEVVAEVPYEVYLRRTFFEPLGMEHTGLELPTWDPADVQHGYAWFGWHVGSPLDRSWSREGPYWNLRGNGDLLSTVGDLFAWSVALETGQILNEAALHKLFARHVRDPRFPQAEVYYGYGWRIVTTARGTRLISHNGSDGTVFADLRIYPDEGVVLIAASNSKGKEAYRYEPGIRTRLFGSDDAPGR